VEESERKELIEFYHDAFDSAVKSGVFEDVPEIWDELIKLEPDNWEAFLSMAEELERLRRNKIAGEMLVSLIEVYRESGNIDGRKAALLYAIRLAPADEQLKEEMAAYYRETRADHPMLEEAIRRADLLRPMTSTQEAVSRLEIFLKFREGDIVKHPTGWGVGRVTEADFEDETLTVDFETRRNHTVSLEMAARILELVPPDSFTALKHLEPDTLKAMAESDPARLLTLLVSDLGGSAPVKTVKTELTKGIVSSSEWSKWWASARKAAMKDPYLAVSGSVSGVVELRDEPMSHNEEIIERLRSAKSIPEKIARAEEYIEHLKSSERSKEVLKPVADELLASVAGSADAPLVVQVAVAIDDLKASCPGLDVQPPSLECVFTPDNAMEVVGGISKAPAKRQALLKLKELYPDQWPGVFEKLYFAGGSELWDVMTKELIDARRHAVVSQIVHEVMARPKEYVELYLWLCRAAITGKYSSVLGEHGRVDLIERLLGLMGNLARAELGESRRDASERKKLLNKGRDILTVSSHKNLRKIIEDSSKDEAQRIYNAANICRGLTEAARDKVVDMVIAEHPELRPKPAAREVTEDVIYTTEDGLRRKQSEFDRVMNDEIPENQRALGAAIAMGDLSENAEYTAAREQQQILMRKAERISGELEHSRIIDPATVTDSAAGIGTRIRIKNLRTGKFEEYTILGPWDSDHERGIISYLAPLAGAFIGKKPGDKVVFDFTDKKDEYELVSVEKAL